MKLRGVRRGAGETASPFLPSILCALALVVLLTTVVIAGTKTASAAKVTVSVDGQSWEWVTCQFTVGGTLKEAGVTLSPKDRVIPNLNVKIGPGMQIRIQRIEDKVVVQSEPVKFRTVVKFNPLISGGRRVAQEGVQGEKEVKYVFRYRDGEKVAQKVLGSKIVQQPVDQIVLVSHPRMLASRDGASIRSIQMSASAYTPFHCGGSASGHCAMGFPAGKGIVAVDPRVIPLGTKLYVEGYGVALAADTGGAIRGGRIDLCYDTYGEAINFGRRTVRVWILGKDVSLE